MSWVTDLLSQALSDNAGIDPSAPVGGGIPGMPPEIAAQMAAMGVSLPGMAAPAEQVLYGADLVAALQGSSMSLMGRTGLTGSNYSGAMPPWARGLDQQVYASPDFDPYFGVVTQQGDERVYMGEREVTRTEGGTPVNKFAAELAPGQTTGGAEVVSDEPRTLTVTQAMNLPYTWDQDEVQAAMEKFREAGLKIDGFDGLVEAWGAVVNRAAMTYAMTEGKREVTPWDVLDLYKSEAKASGTWVDPNGTKTTTSRSVTEVSEGEAWASLQGTVSQLLGRDPSDQEVRDFTYRMGKMAASNPSISRTVTQYKNGEAVSSSTRTDPGFTAADMAQEAYDGAQNDPDYAEYRAASFYFNSLLSALGPIGGQ